MKKIKYEDSSLSIGKGWANLKHGATWVEGVIITPHGFVDVYMQKDFARLDFVCEGRFYMRIYGISMKERMLVCFAKRFAKEITNEKG